MKQILFLALTILHLSAATYYIDFTGGSDSNNGTTSVTPFKHCPGDAQATGTAASTTPAAGDTLIFKGGVTYLLQASGTTGISLNWNGSSGSPITYDGNSAGTFGTGRALLSDTNNPTGHNAFVTTSARSNLTFKSLIFTNIGGSPTLPVDGGSAVAANPGRGISLGQSSVDIQSIIVQDCDFGGLGYYYNQKPMGPNSIDGAGVQFYNGKSILIMNCNFRRVAIGINSLVSSKRTDGLTIANCTFSDSIVWCVNNSTIENSSWQDNITIKGSSFYDYWQMDGTNWTGYSSGPHTDGIFHRNDYAHCQWGTNINFYANLFYNTVFGGGGGTASIYITEGASANIYNNIMYYQGKTRQMSFAGGPITTGGDASPQRINVLNNTFVTAGTPSDFGFGGMTGASKVASGTGSYFHWTNNVCVDTLTGSANTFSFYAANTSAGDTNNIRYDYNIYLSHNTANAHHFQWNGVLADSSITHTLSCPSCGGTRGLQHWDTNSIAGDPLLVVLGSDYTTSDVNLQSGSPARHAGVDLSSMVSYLPSLNIGFNGNTQTNGAPWDMGAMPYVSSCSYAINSTNSTANAAGTIISGSGSVNITTAVDCPWTATANVAWLTVTSGSSGTGNGTTTYIVSANTGVARSGTLTIAGNTFTVNQQGTAFYPLQVQGYVRINGYNQLNK